MSRHREFLRYICLGSAQTTEKRRRLLALASTDEIRAFSDLLYNIVLNNMPLNTLFSRNARMRIRTFLMLHSVAARRHVLQSAKFNYQIITPLLTTLLRSPGLPLYRHVFA